MRIGSMCGVHKPCVRRKAARRRRVMLQRGRGKLDVCRSERCDRRGAVRGARRRLRGGIDLFVEDGAYTTVASAVAILVVLTLLFSAASLIWASSRSADVQVSADATAVAGANVVASYHTAATVADAAVLSLGLAGFALIGGGMVATLIPGAQAQAARTVDAGVDMLRMRNDMAASASRGLQAIEGSLPYLIAANGTRACVAQGGEGLSYTGTVLAAPMTSASEFPALEDDGINTDALEQAAGDLEGAAHELGQAAREAEAKKEAAWRADCGAEGPNMQERADRLTGLGPNENPDYASSITWEPNIALDRARSYYRWRLEHEAPQGTGVEAAADSAARKAFYAYASKTLAGAKVEEQDGTVVCTVELLPRNTEEVRQTALFTDAVWPSSSEEAGLTLHYGAECPGAQGSAGPLVSFASMEQGAVAECPVCSFGVGDVGKTPAASTSIPNGFEYHLCAFTLALREYVPARQYELDAERAARGEAEGAGNAFEGAIAGLRGVRPRIAPPGRYGCVAVVVSNESPAPDELASDFAATVDAPQRGAIAAAVLAPAPATGDTNVLSAFFSSLEERVGSDGPVGIVDSIMDVWGKLLVAYGDAGAGLDEVFSSMTERLEGLGMGPLASWLRDRLGEVIAVLGVEPVDMRVRKPVLTDTSSVLHKAGMGDTAALLDRMRSLPVGSVDPQDMVRALGYELQNYIESLEVTLMEIPLPSGGSIPVTIRLRDIIGGTPGGAS